MRSEAFLSMMKDSMDGALAFRKQMNDFLNKALNEGQMPTRTDMETIKFAVRRMEDRVLDRVEDLSRRVAALEGKVESNGAARPVKRGSKGVKDQS